MRAVSAIVLGLLMAGCYLVHERDRDAAVVADTNVPGCMETPPRPPSDPASPPPPGQPALVVVDTRDVEARALVVDGARVLLLPGEGFREPVDVRDPDGNPVSGAALTTLPRSPIDRFARPDEANHALHLTVLDDAYQPTDRGLTYGEELGGPVSWTWLPWRDAWVVAQSRLSNRQASSIGLHVFDESGNAGETFRASASAPGSMTYALAASERDAFMIIQHPAHTLQGVLIGGHPARITAGPFDLLVSELLGNASPTLVRYGDRYLVTGFDYREVRVAIVDPSDCGRTRVQPLVVAPTGVREPQASVAVAPERGFFAVCYLEGPRLEDMTPTSVSRAMVQVMGDDGTRWGDPIAMTPADVPSGVAGCVWNGHDVWMLYTTMGQTRLARLHPTFL